MQIRICYNLHSSFEFNGQIMIVILPLPTVPLKKELSFFPLTWHSSNMHDKGAGAASLVTVRSSTDIHNVPLLSDIVQQHFLTTISFYPDSPLTTLLTLSHLFE